MEEIETLRKEMANIQFELASLTKSNILKEADKIAREEKIKDLRIKYQLIKKQLTRILLEERKEKYAKNKR